jgi:hypothetical protein
MKVRNFRVRAANPDAAHVAIINRLEREGEAPVKPIKVWECQPDWYECSVVVAEGG